MNSKLLIIIGVALVLLIGGGIGGYFLFVKVDQVHEENTSSLETFGSFMTPGNSLPTEGPNGEKYGTSPTIGNPNISASDKIIVSLSQEKQALIKELGAAKARIQDLEAEVALLNNYKETNERYAPRLMREERNFAIKAMSEYLAGSDDASRFGRFQQDAMIQQSANVYVDLVRRFHLSITDEQRNTLLSNYLPAYAFCIGDNIPFVANNRREEQSLLEYLKTGDSTLLPPQLLTDVETINTPCLTTLNDKVLPLFRADLR